MRIAIVGDSISSRNNGASAVSWPGLLESMIRDGGVFGYEIRNYSIPGLRWRTAFDPTAGWLIGGTLSPLDAIERDGCNIILPCLGVNDRPSFTGRPNTEAISGALAFRAALPDVPVHWVRQNMFDSKDTNDSVVTQADQEHMDEVYATLGGDGFQVNLGKLFALQYSYDMLHPTNSGKQWIASAVYMYLQQFLPLTPIVRNIAWLYIQFPATREQMRMANT